MLRNSILAIVLAFATPPRAGAEDYPPEDQLIKKLQSDAPQEEKAAACRQLAVVGGAASIPALEALLADPALSHMARYALESSVEASAGAALRRALGQLKDKPRIGVIGSLGVRRDAQAVEGLSALLDDPDELTRSAAARALGSIGTPAATQALLKALNQAEPARRGPAAEGLLRAAEALLRGGDRAGAGAIYDAIGASKSPHPIPAAALRGSVISRGDEGIALLEEALRGADFAAAGAAVAIANELKENDAIGKMLVRRLADAPVEKRVLILGALGLRKEPSGVPPAIDAARTGETPVRLAAIDCLSQIADPAAAPALLALMEDGDKTIAARATEALAALPGAEVDAKVEAMFKSGAPEKRVLGMDLIVRRNMTRLYSEIREAATDADPRVRAAAIRRTGEIATPEEMPDMLKLMGRVEGADLDAVEQAIVLLRQRSPSPQAHNSQLIAMLATAKPAQKLAILRLLGGAGGDDALSAVRGVLGGQDADASVRAGAIRVLGAWKGEDASADLLKLAQSAAANNEKLLALRSYLSMSARQDISAPRRLEMCRAAAELIKRPEEAKLLLGSLGQINLPGAVEAILPHLQNEPTRDEAATAVLNIADKLLTGRNAAANAAGLIAPLEKVVAAGPSPALVEKARGLLDRARKAR